jgi:2,5-diketo-D-gluconate reductase A
VDLIDRTGFTPAVNQIETHPYFQRQADHDLMVECGVEHESLGRVRRRRNNLFKRGIEHGANAAPRGAGLPASQGRTPSMVSTGVRPL